ncbi:MAG: GNAT family N-acetyltransferase [Lewinellaceae bacterium]|nr:GNAT family N-acetyltransferase [Lewinellaceae bacterium]
MKKNNDFLFLLVEESASNLIGFVAGRAVSNYEEKDKLPSKISLEKGFYISELGVAESHKKNGWGCKLVNFLINTALLNGFSQFVLVTHDAINNPAKKLYAKLSMQILKNDEEKLFYREVQQKRIDNRPETDYRPYYYKSFQWFFNKTIDISKSKRYNYATIILKIFENGMGIKGWSLERIIEQLEASTLLGLLQNGNSYEGYFFATIPSEQFEGKSILWIDAVSITKGHQKNSWIQKGIDEIMKFFSEYDFGIIGGRSQNPVVFKLFTKIGSGEYLPFSRNYTKSEMDFLIKNIYEVNKPNVEGKLNQQIGICKNTYKEGKLGDYPILEFPNAEQYELLLSQNGFNRHEGDSVILIKFFD